MDHLNLRSHEADSATLLPLAYPIASLLNNQSQFPISNSEILIPRKTFWLIVQSITQSTTHHSTTHHSTTHHDPTHHYTML